MRVNTIFLLIVILLFPFVLFSQEVDKPAQRGEETNVNNTQSVEEVKQVTPVQENTESKESAQNPSVKNDMQKVTEANNSQNKGDIKTDKDTLNPEQKKALNFEYKKYSSFGLNISSHSGIGLSYRYHMQSPLLFQITGGVISEGESFFYAVGGEIQRELSKSKDKRAFGSFAIGIYGERYKETDYEVSYYTGMEPPRKWKTDNAFSFAFGVGGELALGNSTVDAISLGCEIYPIGIYISDNEESNFHMFPGGAIYLFYNF